MLAADLLLQQGFGIWFQSHGFVSWLLLGLVAGWLAGKIARGRGFGCIADIVLGLIGSYIGGWVFTKLGIFGGGFLYSLAAGTVGAVILVYIALLFAGCDNLCNLLVVFSFLHVPNCHIVNSNCYCM